MSYIQVGNLYRKKLVNSGADPAMKYSSAPPFTEYRLPEGGELRFGIEKNNVALFYDNNIGVSFFYYSKSDLLQYLNTCKHEFFFPSQNYLLKNFFDKHFETLYKKIEDLQDEVIKFKAYAKYDWGRDYKKEQTNRAYLEFFTTSDSKAYKTFRSILVPDLTTIEFCKFYDTETKQFFFHMKPVFGKDYTAQELAQLLVEEIKESGVNTNNYTDVIPVINMFGIKFAEQIRSVDDIPTIVSKLSGLFDNEELATNIIQTSLKSQEYIKLQHALPNIYAHVGEEVMSCLQQPQTRKCITPDSFVHTSSQVIRYGAPGTGKSHGFINASNSTRITFHPDSDFSSFVGCYKPSTTVDNKITYTFTPQAFLNAYISAWNTPSSSYTLLIEEINRGNCAQIFGDIFQLLDRDENGFSQYPIKVEADIWNELSKHIPLNYIEVLNEYYQSTNRQGCTFDGTSKIALPPNLSILATMNTSDQSLYKMDSAFKRRWKMEYVPIKYKAKLKEDGTPIEGEEGLYRLEKVHLDFYDKSPWLEILYSINAFIRNRLDSTSKQMGQWFIVPEKEGEDFVDIPFEVFRDKLVFYLFNDVFKKSDILNQPFGKEEDGSLFLFEDLCTEKDGGKALCETFLDNVTKDFPYPKD